MFNVIDLNQANYSSLIEKTDEQIRSALSIIKELEDQLTHER